MSILDEIVAYKREEVFERKKIFSVESLMSTELFYRPTNSLVASIDSRRGKAVIAEFKRRSPSKGIINENVSVEATTQGYQKAGVAGISILTDEKFFGGKTNDLVNARPYLSIPILRKDFIIDSYQIYEAKAIGADVILLIAACLSSSEMEELFQLASSLKLETLFEIHDIEEVAKLPKGVKLVGVNNRNLKNFEVNLEHAKQLCNHLPASCIKVAESGIHSVDDAKTLAQAGFDAFLIGEFFMRQQLPHRACEEFIEALNGQA